jgi:GNAT superfamily N-acetyltransferase
MVRLARPDEIPALAAMLTRAFERDPFYAYLAGDAPEHRQRMRDGWNGILRFASARLVDTWTTDDLAGAAVWIPPGHRSGVFDSLRLLPEMARFVGWRRLRLVSEAVEVLERRRRIHVPGPHYYLSALGVEPARQGTGIGTALLQPVLDRCDREGLTAYLETAVARNVLLYERVGFEVVEELIVPRTDVRGWLMRRSPPS